MFDLVSFASKYATKTTLSAILNSSMVSVVTTETAGRACLVMYETILGTGQLSCNASAPIHPTYAGALRWPAYGVTLSEPRNIFKVG